MNVKTSSSDASKAGPVTFSEPRLLLVEGKDDQQFLSGLIESRRLKGFQVHALGGKTGWRKKVGAVVKDPGFEDNVVAVAIVRDADLAPDDEWRSCVDSLQAAGLTAPTDNARLVEDENGRHIGVSLLPGREQSGALEDFVIPALVEDRLSCVKSYLECLEGKEFALKYRSKVTLQTYLAGLAEPARDLHVAIAQGHVDFSHANFSELADFLVSMESVNSA